MTPAAVPRAERPLPVGARVRQVHGGPILNEGYADERRVSPDGTIVAYNVTDGWVSILYDEWMIRPSDRYGEFLARDLLRYYRRIGHLAAPLTGDEMDLLADHLSLAQLDEVSAAVAAVT